MTFGPVVVDAIVRDSSQLPAAIVFIVHVVGDVLEVLHMGPGGRDTHVVTDTHQQIKNINTC